MELELEMELALEMEMELKLELETEMELKLELEGWSACESPSEVGDAISMVVDGRMAQKLRRCDPA